jgi:glutathione-regulated potassium-efflux system ancillary protein KefG
MTTDHQVLVLFAHPAIRKSRVNRVLVDAIRGVDGITVHDLYEAYPAHDIDVAREQRLLTDHRIVVFQHPLYWYSTPSILKEWQDLVLQHGWAYGHDGTALHGKLFVSAITTGGSEESYRHGGPHRHTIHELLTPIRQMAWLCGMDSLPPFVVHGTLGLDRDAVDRHASDYLRILEALRDGAIDLHAVREFPRLNHDLETALRSR